MPGITNPTEEYFKDGGWGWDGTQWRKLNLTFGYYDRYAEKQEGINVPAGTQTFNFATVPANEVWVITAFTAYCSTANPFVIGLYQIATGVAASEVLTFVGFNSTSSPNVVYTFAQPVEVAATDDVLVTITNLDKQSQDIYSTIIGSEV